MNPIIDAYINQGAAGYELMQAIAEAASTYNGPRFQIHERGADEPAQDVRKGAARTKARDVIQTRKGFVRFIF